MTQRERVMAGIVGGAAALYFGYVAIQKVVLEPARETATAIQNEQAYREKLEGRLNGARKTIEDWSAETGRTLSDSGFDAHQAFREDVGLLLKRNHLTEELKITKYKERVDKKWPREGFTELPVQVRVKGKLQDLDNFLKDFFQRPYMVRMEKLSIDADLAAAARSKRETKGKGKGRERARDESKLTISMMVTTLVLPKQDGQQHPTFDLAKLNDPNPDENQPIAFADRLRHEPEEYRDIYAKNLFEKWSPPAPPTPSAEPKTETPKVVVNEHKQAATPTPQPPPDNRDKFVVTAVGRLDDGPIVYVTDTRAATEPPEEYRLNDELDKGKLILIVPEGIVVQETSKQGRHSTMKNYFYPLGRSFKDRVEVNPTEHPTIARYLEIVLAQRDSES